MINRGGEKISPREIEEALLAHPEVAEAVAFAMPHPRLGEDVGAAVVLRGGRQTSPQALQRFAAQRLADFKVPRVIRIVPEIPKGPTGKPLRVGLAAALGVEAVPGARERRHISSFETEWERRLAALWRDVLGVETVARDDDFFELGGDSALATLVTARLGEQFGVTLPLAEFFERPVLAEVARRLESEQARPLPDGVVALRTAGDRPALFCHPGLTGSLRLFVDLTQHLAPEQPVYGFTLPRWSRELADGGIGGLAEARIGQIQAVQPRGPYFLVGACLGGVVALEIAQRLAARGEAVGLLAMVDTFNPAWNAGSGGLALRLRHGAGRVAFHLKALAFGGPIGRKEHLRIRAQTFLRARREEVGLLLYRAFARPDSEPPRWLRRTEYALRLAERRYQPSRYAGRVLLFASSDPRAAVYPVPLMGWQDVLCGEAVEFRFPGSHEGLLAGAHASQIARLISACLDEARCRL